MALLRADLHPKGVGFRVVIPQLRDVVCSGESWEPSLSVEEKWPVTNFMRSAPAPVPAAPPPIHLLESQ